MVRLIQGMRRRCKARNSQKKARKEWEKQKPPRKVEPLPRGKVQERKKENRSAALGDAVRFLSFAESVGWAFPACSRNEVRREACPFSAEYRGKEKPRSVRQHMSGVPPFRVKICVTHCRANGLTIQIPNVESRVFPTSRNCTGRTQ